MFTIQIMYKFRHSQCCCVDIKLHFHVSLLFFFFFLFVFYKKHLRLFSSLRLLLPSTCPSLFFGTTLFLQNYFPLPPHFLFFSHDERCIDKDSCDDEVDKNNRCILSLDCKVVRLVMELNSRNSLHKKLFRKTWKLRFSIIYLQLHHFNLGLMKIIFF